MKIIAISGKAQSGKDFFANMIKGQLEYYNEKPVIIHYADYLKFICERYFGWNGEKDEKGRELLQKVGTDVVRQVDDDYWVKTVSDFIRIFSNNFTHFIIPDCRFPNEIEYLKSIYGDDFHSVHLIRVNRDGTPFENSLTKEQKEHPSETALDNFEEFNYTIINDGLEESLLFLAEDLIYSIKNNEKAPDYIENFAQDFLKKFRH